jgi:hypothetical protein
LKSETDKFLTNHLPDGVDVDFDMGFFKAMEGITAEDAAKLTEQMAAEAKAEG